MSTFIDRLLARIEAGEPAVPSHEDKMDALEFLASSPSVNDLLSHESLPRFVDAVGGVDAFCELYFLTSEAQAFADEDAQAFADEHAVADPAPDTGLSGLVDTQHDAMAETSGALDETLAMKFDRFGPDLKERVIYLVKHTPAFENPTAIAGLESIADQVSTERLSGLIDFLEELPEKQRDAVCGHWLGEERFSELVSRLGCSESDRLELQSSVIQTIPRIATLLGNG